MANGVHVSVLARNEGETLRVLGAPMVVKSDGSGGGAFVVEHDIGVGYAVPMHVHERDDEMFYVLEGELTLEDGSGVRRAGPGSFVVLPKGVPHAFRNDGAADVRFLIVTAPGVTTAEMFRHFDRAGSPVPEEIGAIPAQYGVKICAGGS